MTHCTFRSTHNFLGIVITYYYCRRSRLKYSVEPMRRSISALRVKVYYFIVVLIRSGCRRQLTRRNLGTYVVRVARSPYYVTVVAVHARR